MNPISAINKIMDYFCPASEQEATNEIQLEIEKVATEQTKEKTSEWGNAHFGD